MVRRSRRVNKDHGRWTIGFYETHEEVLDAAYPHRKRIREENAAYMKRAEERRIAELEKMIDEPSETFKTFFDNQLKCQCSACMACDYKACRTFDNNYKACCIMENRKLCTFYAERGFCRLGNACRFRHEYTGGSSSIV